MKLKRKDFDIILSLGGNCSAAGQLKHRGLRRCSFPLDWTWMGDEKPIRKLPVILESRFANFLQWENITHAEHARKEAGRLVFDVSDSYSGISFTHHFYGKHFDRPMFDRCRQTLQRRIERLYKEVDKSESALFILETAFAYDDSLAEDVFRSLRNTFPKCDVHLVVMEFSADECSEAWSHDEHMVIAKYHRPLNVVYDNQFTGHEWCWMDSLTMKGVDRPEIVRKRNLLVKYAFKIWWKMGKWLESKGAGVVNMRLRDFGDYTIQDSREHEQTAD